MTVTADLQKHHAVKQRLFLRIDGLESRIWQDDGSGTIPSWDTTGKLGLQPPSELSMSLDITTMRSEASAMTFELLDIKDTDGLSWWGKRIAPAAWDAVNAHWRINVGSVPHTYIDANAATIPLKDDTNHPGAGTFYVGQETITAAAEASNQMTGVVKGLYPIVSDTVTTYGQTYLRPQATDAGYQMHVGTVPFTWHGRRVGLYVTTYDTASARYTPQSGTHTIWSDAFGTAAIDSHWEQDPNAGTINAVSGVMRMLVDLSANAGWDATYKNAPMSILRWSAVGASGTGLLRATCTLQQNEVGNLRYTSMGLILDDENAHLYRFNQSGGVGTGYWIRRDLVANVLTEGSWAAGGAWPITVTIYYNLSATTQTVEGTEAVAPGYVSAWASWNGGTKTKLETFAATVAPTGFVLSTENTTGGGSPALSADFDNFTLEETVEAGAGAKLLWAGRISNTIKYSPKSCSWKLACESILADLERPIATNPHVASVKGINLTGTKGRQFTIARTNGDGTVWLTYSCTIAAKHYDSASALASAVAKAMATATPACASGSPPATPFFFCSVSGDECKIQIRYKKQTYTSHWLLQPWQYKNPYNPCHGLFALGFMGVNKGVETSSDEGSLDAVTFMAEKSVATDYHPCHHDYNGSKLYVDDALSFWPNQGDDSTAGGWVAMDLILNDKATQFADKYTARTAGAGSAADYLTLTAAPQGDSPHSYSYVALREDGDESDSEIKQVYCPTYMATTGTPRGPFEALLYPLLSTGTTNYNSTTYDKCPLQLSAGVQLDLVDTASFVDADKEISMSPLAIARVYVIDKSTPWMDLLCRECLLYGYAVVWSRGKIRLRDVTYPSRATAEITIDESCRAVRTEAPDTDMPVDTVVNNYQLELGDTVPIEIGDADSIAMFGQRTVEIKHPGLSVAIKPSDLAQLLKQLLLERPYRFPSPIVEVSLAPYMIDRVYPGDVVLYTSTTTPDPSGGGGFSMSEYALVLDASWDHRTLRGAATLMLMVQYSWTGMPWCPAALITAHDTAVVTLAANEFGKTGDPDDGTAFHANDAVLIIERNPVDPTDTDAIQSYARTLVDDYGDEGAGQFTLSATLDDYDATKEYVMVFGDYADIVLAQKVLGSWIANSATELIAVNTKAYRYG